MLVCWINSLLIKFKLNDSEQPRKLVIVFLRQHVTQENPKNKLKILNMDGTWPGMLFLSAGECLETRVVTKRLIY